MIAERNITATRKEWEHVLRRYWTLMKVSFQERMEYRWNTIAYTFLALLPALVGIFLWTTVLGGKDNPVAVQQITTYYVVATFVGWRIPQFQWLFMRDIREGGMATALLRPMSYPSKVFWYEVGGRAWSTLITLPIFLILALLLGDNFKTPDSIFTWLLAIMSFLLSFVLTFYLTATLGLITIWQNQPEGFFALFGFASNTLGGVVVPLALMPNGIGDILQWLPFAYIYSLPVKIFQGLPGDQLVQGFAVQLLWVAVSGLFFGWVWRKATRRYEVYEGQ